VTTILVLVALAFFYLLLSGVAELVADRRDRRFMEGDWRKRWR
jgi:hypothetical protein